ncbi:MAG: protein kinase, partial [Gemmatimonadaceae bacterium]
MTAAAFPPKSLLPFVDALAPRYRVERELGRGGMATVYLATDLQTETPVAIKVLLPELAASIGADRFLREIEVGRTLQHPSIVGVIDSGEADGRLFYVMPLVDGTSLRERLDVQQQLDIDEALDIVRQVSEGLDFAHSKGIIHRDIKPENILLSGKRAMLADFGIARAVTLAGGEKLTQTGVAVGTPTYMSPEQAMGSKDVTPESDIYSLACVLYEMLAGQPPFTGPTAMAILARHSLDSIPSLKIVRSTIPDAVEDAIAKAMAKVPADRYHSVQAFVHALGDHELAARKRTASMQAAARLTLGDSAPSSTLGSNRRRIGVFAAVAAVVLVGGVAAWKYFGRGVRGAEDGPPATEIAVLYLDDRSSGHTLGYLADGLTEALIQELSQVSGLHVVSRNGVAPFKGHTIATDSVSRQLGVGTLVTGTVQSSQDSLRVNVQLVKARTGRDLRSITLARPRSESFELQDDLAREVTNFLRKGIGIQVELEGNAGTRNAEAYEAYQRARQLITDAEKLLAAGKAQAASQQLTAADTAFQKVSTLDPAWVAPIVQRGWLSYRQSRLLTVLDRPTYSKWLQDGLLHAASAIGTEPKNVDALELRGTLRYWQWLLNIVPDSTKPDKLLADAEADLNAAVAINPQQASAWNVLSHLRMAKSRTSEGKLAALKAYETDPYLTDVNRTLWRLVQASLDLGDEADARKYCDVGARRFSEDFRFTECKLWLLTLKMQTKPTPTAIWSAYDAFIKASPANVQGFHKLKGGMLAAIALIRAG